MRCGRFRSITLSNCKRNILDSLRVQLDNMCCRAAVLGKDRCTINVVNSKDIFGQEQCSGCRGGRSPGQLVDAGGKQQKLIELHVDDDLID